MTSPRNPEQMREDAVAIWNAAVQAAASDRLVSQNLQVDGGLLHVADDVVSLHQVRRISVVGAGKAGAGMAAGLESALGESLMLQKQVTGWINVPADCVRPLRHITLHAARPAGVNEPTAEGVSGSEKILEIVESLGHDDLCICLLSGGGSALLPAPAPGISLADKLAVTRHLSAAGANIEQLNTVRKQLSHIKGGGLARACRAGRLITLIISDVLGDPLDVIASGPTVPNTTTARDALEVLREFPLSDRDVAAKVDRFLQDHGTHNVARDDQSQCVVSNYVIGNNAVAVDAGGLEAERRGYSHAMLSARQLEGDAEDIGIHLAHVAREMRDGPGSDCLISGGEPTVTLVDAAERGMGGRNQQLVLAAYCELMRGAHQPSSVGSPWLGLLILSGGTDGEDGPTDAAGALADQTLSRACRPPAVGRRQLPSPQRCLSFLRAAQRPAQDRPDPYERV